MKLFTFMGWLVSFIACVVMAFLLASFYGVLLALAVGAVTLTLLIRLEELHTKQDNIRYRLEELYELLKRNEDSRAPDKTTTLFVRCDECNGRYEKDADGCPFCSK